MRNSNSTQAGEGAALARKSIHPAGERQQRLWRLARLLAEWKYRNLELSPEASVRYGLGKFKIRANIE